MSQAYCTAIEIHINTEMKKMTDYVVFSTAQQSSWSRSKHLHTNLLLNDFNTGYILQHIRTYQQLKGSVKEPNISIYFFRPSLNGVLFLMFCLLVERSDRFVF